jgi:hypothetical protein
VHLGTCLGGGADEKVKCVTLGIHKMQSGRVKCVTLTHYNVTGMGFSGSLPEP